MIILPQTIKTKWNSKFKKYYESKGYKYTKIGDEFEVDVLDLPQTSQRGVKAKCDYCGKELTVQYFRANEHMKVSCKHCKSLRTKEMYGWSSTWQLEKTKESIKKTNLEKYGVEHNSYNPITIKKRKLTCLKRYGVDNIFKLKEIQEKIEINRLKAFYKNGTGPSSSQQRHICDLLNGELNYPVSRCLLDIAFPNEMIYVEYDGGGHNLSVKIGSISQEEFNKKEIRRQKYLKNLGWKLIRIKSKNDILLEDNKIINLINKCKNYLLNSNHSWIEINIDKMQIIKNNNIIKILYEE